MTPMMNAAPVQGLHDDLLTHRSHTAVRCGML